MAHMLTTSQRERCCLQIPRRAVKEGGKGGGGQVNGERGRGGPVCTCQHILEGRGGALRAQPYTDISKTALCPGCAPQLPYPPQLTVTPQRDEELSVFTLARAN